MKFPTALSVGDALPECALIDHNGQPLKLSAFQGRVLAITFIFTRCPLPDYCPLLNRHFQAIQTALSKSYPAAKWQLLSISLDPQYDDVNRLANYVKRERLGGPSWKFATGQVDDIAALGACLGLVVTRKDEELNHNLRTVLVDANGRIQRILPGNSWRAEELIEEMRSELATPH